MTAPVTSTRGAGPRRRGLVWSGLRTAVVVAGSSLTGAMAMLVTAAGTSSAVVTLVAGVSAVIGVAALGVR